MKNSPDCTVSYASFLQSKLCLPSPQNRGSSGWAVGSGQQAVGGKSSGAAPKAVGKLLLEKGRTQKKETSVRSVT